MTKIKIISNPYENTVSYEKIGVADQAWRPIASDSAYSGKLITEKFSTGFFPFKVSDIVDEIVDEYGGSSEPVEIVFEGADDEFESLEIACAEELAKGTIVLDRSPRYLSNAREIIRDVVSLFGELAPLIRESTEDKESAQKDIDKISEASSNIVPICVLGNYSSGKSTFINSLIGAEYLPSADRPFTAKAYRISRRLQGNAACIRFKLDGGRQIELDFYKEKFSQVGLTKDEPFLEELLSRIEACKQNDLVSHVNCAIAVINDFEKGSKKLRISDMVEVEVPFSDIGLLSASENEFIIFDTPGSNSATYRNHMQVLRNALEGMSNGIPIFVSVYDQLDSDDADELSAQICHIKGLDSRFTMIVVSKADQANIPPDGFNASQIEDLRAQAVVSKLYSNGLYFVSSLIGLGAKNGGQFVDQNLRKHYGFQISAYTDEESQYYTELYKYNIMSNQMKREAMDASRECGEKAFANSGLFCVEHEIELFSDKYAAYNKCRQMEQALERAYDRAACDTEAEILSRQKTRDMLGEKLDEDTKKLVDEISATGARVKNASERGYPENMDELLFQLRPHQTAADLKSLEEEIAEAQRELLNLDDEKKDVSVAWDSLFRGIKRNLGVFAENPDLSSINAVRDGIARDIKNVFREMREVAELKEDATQATIDKLVQSANKFVDEEIESALAQLDARSKGYWTAQAERLRDEYSAIIAGTSALPDTTKTRLGQQIVEFAPIYFENEVVFRKADFLLRPLDVISKGRLARAYNQTVSNAVSTIYSSIKDSHFVTFGVWLDAFEAMIVSDITELSPFLHEQAELIKEQNARISMLAERQAKLQGLVSQVRNKIDWKDAPVEEV